MVIAAIPVYVAMTWCIGPDVQRHASRKSRPWTPGSTAVTSQSYQLRFQDLPRCAKSRYICLLEYVSSNPARRIVGKLHEIGPIDSFKAHVTEKYRKGVGLSGNRDPPNPMVYHFHEQHGYDWGVFYHFIIICHIKIDFNCHSQGEVPPFQTGAPHLCGHTCENALPCEAGIVIQLLHEALDLTAQRRAIGTIGTWPAKNGAFHYSETWEIMGVIMICHWPSLDNFCQHCTLSPHQLNKFDI